MSGPSAPKSSPSSPPRASMTSGPVDGSWLDMAAQFEESAPAPSAAPEALPPPEPESSAPPAAAPSAPVRRGRAPWFAVGGLLAVALILAAWKVSQRGAQRPAVAQVQAPAAAPAQPAPAAPPPPPAAEK